MLHENLNWTTRSTTLESATFKPKRTKKTGGLPYTTSGCAFVCIEMCVETKYFARNAIRLKPKREIFHQF